MIQSMTAPPKMLVSRPREVPLANALERNLGNTLRPPRHADVNRILILQRLMPDFFGFEQ
jgi:hypothetical protein